MKSTQAKAAKEIRDYLKSKGIAANVTSHSASMTSSVRVKVNDLQPDVFKEIEQRCKQYQYGHFDGMQDMYEYSNSNPDLPQAKYVFVENYYSDEFRQKAWNYIRSTCNGADTCAKKVSDLSYSDQVFNEQANTIIWRLLNGSMDDLSKKFWESINPKEVLPKACPTCAGIFATQGNDDICPTCQDSPHEEQIESPTLTADPCLNCAGLLSDAKIEEHVHTKTGKKMYIVVPAKMLGREVFLQLRKRAKAMKGWWSWYKGAPNGFAFNNMGDAILFVGKESPLNCPNLPLNCSPLPYSNPTAIELKAIADEMQPEIDRHLLNLIGVTLQRIVLIERKRFQGLRLQRTQKVLYRLAELHEQDRVADILRQFITKESVYEWMGSKPKMIVRGLYSYPICTGTPYYDTNESKALWKLLE